MKTFIQRVLLTAAVLAVASAASFAQWNLIDDFSQTDNPAGEWSYGYLDGAGENFTLYTDYGTSASNGSTSAGWRAPGDWDSHGNLAFNFGPNVINAWTSIREVNEFAAGPPMLDEKTCARWTAPTSGTYHIYVKISGRSTKSRGTTIGCYVYVNGDLVDSGAVQGFEGTKANNYSDASGEAPVYLYEGDVSLSAGNTVDAAFDAGPDGCSADATGINVIITPTSGVSMITGTVIDEATSLPLADVTVTAGNKSVKTGSNGTYSIFLAAGTYTVEFTKGGYDVVSQSVAVPEAEAATLNVSMARKTSFTTYYVNGDSGNDNRNGLTPATAWKSMNNGSAKNLLAPGDTVIVTGTFTGTQTLTNRNSAADSFADIKFVSDGAHIELSDNSNACIALTGTNAHHITIDGFDIKGGRWGMRVMNGANNITVKNCYFHSINSSATAEGCGIWDQGAANHDNLYYRNSFKLIGPASTSLPHGCITVGQGDGIFIYNNTFDQATNGLRTWNQAKNVYFINNIVTNMSWAGIHSDSDAPDKIRNSYNMFWANAADYSNNEAGEGDLHADPMYVGEGDNAQIYKLQSGSPAIEAGTDVGFDDYIGFAPDMGAWESDAASDAAFITGTVYGTSQYSQGRTLLAGAVVTISSESNTYTVTTNSKGVYRQPVNPGTYTLHADYSGYSSENETVTAATGDYVVKNIGIDLGVGRVFYVSPGGSDFADGKSPNTAWQTINNGDILGLLNPGDVVTVMEGKYPLYDSHGVWLFNCDGTEMQPIIYSARGKVILDQTGMDPELGNGMISCMFVANSYHIFDGFELSNSQWGIYLRDNEVGNTVTNCVFHDMYPLNNSSNNVLEKCAAGVVNSISSGNTIAFNRFYNIGHPGQLCTAAIANPVASDIKIYNNTFDNCWSSLFSWGSSPTGIEFKNNIVTNMWGSGLYADWAGSITHDYNMFYGNAADFSPALSAAAHEKFENPNCLAGYAPASGSPAIDAGVNVGYAFKGAAPDMGAVESDYAAAASADAEDITESCDYDNVASGKTVAAMGHKVLGYLDADTVVLCRPDRLGGVLAKISDGIAYTPAPGDEIRYEAVATADANGERVLLITKLLSAAPGEKFIPLGFNGAAYAKTMPAFTPVKVWGKVVATDDALTLDDGSGFPVRVYTTLDTSGYAVGDFIAVTGISYCGDTVPAVIATDIVGK
ncbi:MAG: carboxypeptidase regulatory-like domain-containing protein [Abditibacteriota bacterium]|nr:carboxypeptidase regulatory-like domain-containing protein [Abditibacteriota bacterium]